MPRGGYRPGAGRKKSEEKDRMIVRDIRLLPEDYALIPGNKQAYMRQAVVDKLIADGFKTDL